MLLEYTYQCTVNTPSKCILLKGKAFLLSWSSHGRSQHSKVGQLNSVYYHHRLDLQHLAYWLLCRRQLMRICWKQARHLQWWDTPRLSWIVETQRRSVRIPGMAQKCLTSMRWRKDCASEEKAKTLTVLNNSNSSQERYISN